FTTASRVSITAKAVVGDLRISKIEWGQTIVTATPRLVAGKPALLRVYALANAPGIAGVTVRAEGFHLGTSLGTLALKGPASPPTAEDAANPSQQYSAVVPAEWVAPGLSIHAAVDPDDLLGETDETNNALISSPDVGAGTVLEL